MATEQLHIGDCYDGFLFLAETVRNPPKLASHQHVELELNLVAHGEVAYVVDGRHYLFKKRSLFWLFPDQAHQLVSRSADAEYFVAVFKPKMILEACRSAHAELASSRPPKENEVASCRLDPVLFDQVCGAMNSLIADGLDPDLLNREAGFGVTGSAFTFEHGDPDLLNAGLRHLLLWCWKAQLRARRSQQGHTLHSAVQRALLMLQDEHQDFNLSELASASDVSESYLSRLFRQELGVTLTDYRNSVRLSRFWERRRRHPSETTLQAAISSGFGSYAQFYRIYHATYGAKPKDAARSATR